MGNLKKVSLDPSVQESLWKLLQDQNDVVANVMGREVHLSIIDSGFDEIAHEIDSDPELREVLLASEEDIKEGRTYTTQEAIDYILKEHSL
ncbi:hypothetical protein [Ferroacidibacillus organovorans]|uniref:Uncharacterized protein n=1 Tax=Ferroacidibacillus organovorans TaxID=1765683 RepID=A0A853KBC9_9BACL|nr:hypothetical protein [Ferroacidibacillus organovorans]KYP81645.1 hypothetical protein AYJ22_06350 [Ferroacidibacillus organovorans]OAG94157.1 hypothetical protein AYW79_06970 [Ferroacidibacillus organovorans]